MRDIDKGIRMTNFLIDSFILGAIFIIFSIIIQQQLSDNILFYSFMILYYVLFESINGQTIGKMVTKTRVVDKDGTKAGVGKIIIRTLLRIIPIDAFSYLFGTELGFHDILSYTKLTKYNKSHLLNKYKITNDVLD